MKKVLQIAADEFEWVGVCLAPSTFGACKNGFANVPAKEPDSWTYPNPAPSLPQQYSKA
jgi:peptide/nickel transport system substrate-binding protein